MGRNDAVAVADEEGWYHSKGLRGKTLVDGRESIQGDADGRVHSVNISLEFRDPRRVRVGRSGRIGLSGESMDRVWRRVLHLPGEFPAFYLGTQRVEKLWNRQLVARVCFHW